MNNAMRFSTIVDAFLQQKGMFPSLFWWIKGYTMSEMNKTTYYY